MAKSNSFIPIPEDALPALIGKQVHVTWARHGCTWNLIGVKNGFATLMTPKTKRTVTTPISKLLYTKKHAPEGASTKGRDNA